jgi:putative oxidoreductase
MRGADVSFLILRLTVAIVMWPHGAQKALGLFGGHGIAGTVGGLSHLGIPAVLAYLVIAAEFLGPIALVLGVLTRLAALGIAIDMAVAALLVHAKNGFFMNFNGQQAGEGVEYFILIVGIGLALAVGGSGRYAILPRT